MSQVCSFGKGSADKMPQTKNKNKLGLKIVLLAVLLSAFPPSAFLLNQEGGETSPLWGGQLFPVAYAQEQKTTAAVMDLEAKEGVSAGAASMLSDYLRTQLVNIDKYTIVTRENMEEILQEQQFQVLVKIPGTQYLIICNSPSPEKIWVS